MRECCWLPCSSCAPFPPHLPSHWPWRVVLLCVLNLLQSWHLACWDQLLSSRSSPSGAALNIEFNGTIRISMIGSRPRSTIKISDWPSASSSKSVSSGVHDPQMKFRITIHEECGDPKKQLRGCAGRSDCGSNPWDFLKCAQILPPWRIWHGRAKAAGTKDNSVVSVRQSSLSLSQQSWDKISRSQWNQWLVW